MSSKPMKKNAAILFAILMIFNLFIADALADDMQEIIAAWEYGVAPKSTVVTATVGQHRTGAELTNFINTIPAFRSGGLSIDGWDGDAALKYWQISMSTKGYKDVALFAKASTSERGPRNFKITYSVNSGISWKDVPEGAYTIKGIDILKNMPTVALPAETFNKDNLLIRFQMIPQSPSPQGISTINNIILSGNPIWTNATRDVATVTALPGSCKVVLGTKIDLSCNDKDAVIMYSINEGEYEEYDTVGKIPLTMLPATVKAYATKDGQNSSITTFYYE